MSTFLDSGDILIKCDNRFLIYSNKGEFIVEVEFQDSDSKPNAKEMLHEH